MRALSWPTGYHGAELAGVQPGGTVAVFGAGPVGLMAVLSSVIKGASEVYCVDFAPERLRLAKVAGAIPVDAGKGDPVEQIMQMRNGNSVWRGAQRRGEERLNGVMHGIDAVGYRPATIRSWQKRIQCKSSTT